MTDPRAVLVKGQTYAYKQVNQWTGYEAGNMFMGGIYYWGGSRNPDAMILIDTPGKHYGDFYDGLNLDYVGMGQSGDQSLSRQNLRIAERIGSEFPFIFFQRVWENGRRVLRFEGFFFVRSYRWQLGYDKDDQPRQELRFWFDREELVFGIDDSDIVEPADASAKRTATTTYGFERDPLFRKEVLGRYGELCCICGEQVSIAKLSFIEAAHIYPRSERGRNTPENGIPLCRNHHWLYDAHGFAFESDFSVISSAHIRSTPTRVELPQTLRFATEERPGDPYIRARLKLFENAQRAREH